jgi:two-component system, NtrC family, sensor histidine kinase HydH
MIRAQLLVAPHARTARQTRVGWAKVRRMAAPPAGLAEVRRLEQGRATRELLVLRAAVVPILIGIAVWQWYSSGGSRARLLAIGFYYVLVFAHLVFLFQQRRRGVQTRTLGIASTITALGITSLTGGLDSPFILALPLSTIATTMGGSRLEGWAGMVLVIALLPLLAAAGGTRPIVSGGMILFGVTIGIIVGFTIRGMFDRMVERAARAHEDVLRAHSEQLHALTALTGEIAHELKTPLASINGLTGLALLELDTPPRAAERLEILRGEAVRMQKLLDDFLDFSRPLSPLAIDTVDGLRLGEEAVELFEGLMHERRLSIALSGGPVALRCDARKIKQLLINLVQNAVEASAPGGEVRIEVEPGPRAAAIRVLDRGIGLPANVSERIFEAGVTTKARGSGLGLTIARTIAEQHGGSLSLRARQGGGCVAELVLPRAAAAQAEGRAA